MIRPVTAADASAIAAIYNHYVTDTIITFETEPVSAETIATRIGSVTGGGYPWLVAEHDGEVVGYAYGGLWKERTAYHGISEITLYLAPSATGKGVGKQLYGELLPLLQAQGLRGVMAVIALPNDASVAIHERFGLTQAGLFKRVGVKFDQEIDVGYWQKLF